MKTIADRVIPKGLAVLATAEFTADMAENLMQMFSQARDGELVMLQICDWGVWGVTSQGVRMFIGSTHAFEGKHADRATGLQ